MSQKLRNTSFFCACLVVCIHVGVHCGWYTEYFRNGICRAAVPYFFMVSGFFLAKHFDESDWYKVAVQKKVKTLLLPYIYVNIIYSLVITAIHHVGVVFYDAKPLFQMGLGLLLEVCGFVFPGTPMCLTMWFVRALILIVLISPVLKLGSNFGKGLVLLAVTFLCHAFSQVFIVAHSDGVFLHDLLKYGLPIEGLAFFSLGLFLRKHKDFLQIDGKIPVVTFLIGMIIVVLSANITCHPFILSIITISSRILIALGMAGCIGRINIPSRIAQSAFMIFAFHPLVHYLIVSGLKALGRESFMGSAFMGGVLIGMGIFVPVCLYILMLKMSPRILGHITGGRL